ncbi:MAG: hypothetical protein ACYCO5_09090 [Acidobacteriaceae bacterium]
MSSARRAKLAELTGQLRIGAEYFLNRTDAEAPVEKQFQEMHATGLALVRIFAIWDDVERVAGWEPRRRPGMTIFTVYQAGIALASETTSVSEGTAPSSPA